MREESRSPSSPRFDLNQDVQFVKGVGPVRAKLFAKLGVHSVRDLIEFFPFRHDHRPKSIPIGALELGKTATIVGGIRRVRSRGRGRGCTVQADVIDATGVTRVRWFHSEYLLDQLHHGAIVRLTGKVDVYGDLASFTNPQTTVIDSTDEDPLANERDVYEPVYPSTSGLESREIRRILLPVLERAEDAIVDIIPSELRARRNLPSRRAAIQRFHLPTSLEDVEVARTCIAFEELLLLQLAVQMARNAHQDAAHVAAPISVNPTMDERIRGRIPFDLTPGQESAVREIVADLSKTKPMNRLLQGDVGAGKTAVIVYAALATIANRKQVVMLAPTEILAAQHRAKVERYLEGSRVRIGYLTGSTPKRERDRILAKVADGSVDWLIGTHAVLNSDDRFAQMGLAVIDEQHKFGVAQRMALRSKGKSAHQLVVTATPIPRTLAMTLFGDLDATTIGDLPPGRSPVETRLVTSDVAAKAWEYVRKRIATSEQAYLVYPLVEESDSLPLKAATAEVERLRRDILPGARVGLLHGRLKASEKADVMRQFEAGELDVLVSTTVVEVGVDVPNATMMLIQHAERYGLSQLHQLRGRVGRGSKKSCCLLFAEPNTETALARLSILCESNDGFRIAEEDLRIRGPGELLGTRQHGLPPLKVANLVTDVELLTTARDDASAILRTDPHLDGASNIVLRQAVLDRYGDSLHLLCAG